SDAPGKRSFLPVRPPAVHRARRRRPLPPKPCRSGQSSLKRKTDGSGAQSRNAFFELSQEQRFVGRLGAVPSVAEPLIDSKSLGGASLQRSRQLRLDPGEIGPGTFVRQAPELRRRLGTLVPGSEIGDPAAQLAIELHGRVELDPPGEQLG